MRACARGLESAGMRPESLTIAFALATALLAGCGQFKLPEALTPPEFAPVGQRAPEFNVLAEDPGRPGWFREVRSESFEGSILVAMGAQPGFVGELLPWLEVLEAKYGRPRIAGSGESDAGRYTVILIVERGSFNLADRAQEPTLAMLRSLMPSGLTLHLDPRRDFVDSKETEKSRFGFVGEGPHIAVVSADGTLLALIEGPVSERRAARLVEAMDRAFSLVEKKRAEGPAVTEPPAPPTPPSAGPAEKEGGSSPPARSLFGPGGTFERRAPEAEEGR